MVKRNVGMTKEEEWRRDAVVVKWEYWLNYTDLGELRVRMSECVRETVKASKSARREASVSAVCSCVSGWASVRGMWMSGWVYKDAKVWEKQARVWMKKNEYIGVQKTGKNQDRGRSVWVREMVQWWVRGGCVWVREGGRARERRCVPETLNYCDHLNIRIVRERRRTRKGGRENGWRRSKEKEEHRGLKGRKVIRRKGEQLWDFIFLFLKGRG